ncbi:hypothetical protein NEOLEDRAFT_1184449 [Neolentinus lepideus HHB14362 ss-1]|uniref:Uncharacterized protein n=1 Tax=Neolentinus lepideus HHB14362 ss-1 TaxID=1314782 RepID=A0A165MF01_9AGAM|nr:hypothetical protein NEOLEDRAFT_1184449 [Neolentinus lepideus HHB14362 ss-1]
MDPSRPLWYPPDQWEHLPRDVQNQIASTALPPRPRIHDFDRDGPCGDPFPQQNTSQINHIDPTLQHVPDTNRKKKKKKKKTKKRSPDTRDDGDEVDSYSQTQTQGQSTDTHGDVSRLHTQSPPLEFPPSPTFSQPRMRSPTPRHWSPPLPEHAFSHSRHLKHVVPPNTQCQHEQDPAELSMNQPENRTRTQALFNNINSLKAQNAALESHKQDRMRHQEEPSDESDSDEDDGEQNIQGILRYKTLLQSNLPPHLQAAKNFLQHFQCQAFRHLCGVNSSQNWPSIDEPREDDCYTPDFDEDVTHATNSAICKRVADSVYTELKGLRELPDELRHPNRNKRNTQRYQRRSHTLNHLLSVVPEYIKQYRCDPTPILEIDVISNYASGPESDDNEPQHMWKAHMGAQLGVDIRKIDKKMWADTICWEHIVPEWCSEEKYQAYRMYRTGQSTTTPPTYVPWDFAISEKWWNDHHPSWKKQTHKWYSRGDPEGFGKKDPQGAAVACPSSASRG